VTCAVDGFLGLKWSLNLHFCLVMFNQSHGSKVHHSALSFGPLSILRVFVNPLTNRLGANRTNLSLFIVVDDGRDFAISAH